jgi:hypothetical protein
MPSEPAPTEAQEHGGSPPASATTASPSAGAEVRPVRGGRRLLRGLRLGAVGSGTAPGGRSRRRCGTPASAPAAAPRALGGRRGRRRPPGQRVRRAPRRPAGRPQVGRRRPQVGQRRALAERVEAGVLGEGRGEVERRGHRPGRQDPGGWGPRPVWRAWTGRSWHRTGVSASAVGARVGTTPSGRAGRCRRRPPTREQGTRAGRAPGGELVRRSGGRWTGRAGGSGRPCARCRRRRALVLAVGSVRSDAPGARVLERGGGRVSPGEDRRGEGRSSASGLARGRAAAASSSVARAAGGVDASRGRPAAADGGRSVGRFCASGAQRGAGGRAPGGVSSRQGFVEEARAESCRSVSSAGGCRSSSRSALVSGPSDGSPSGSGLVPNGLQLRAALAALVVEAGPHLARGSLTGLSEQILPFGHARGAAPRWSRGPRRRRGSPW